MSPIEGFNKSTVDWQQFVGKIDISNLPAYAAKAANIDTFQKDGVARLCKRPIETSPPYPDHNMQPGDPMREDWFPILWEN